MDVKHVKMFREQAGDQHYIVVCDNMLMYHANVPFNYILWDDTNEVFYAIKLSDDQYHYNDRCFSFCKMLGNSCNNYLWYDTSYENG